MSTRHAVISAVAWITVFTASTAWAEAPVLFVDPKLKSAVEEALGVLDPTPADMGSWPVVTVESDEGLSFTGRGFACTFGGIEDLTGLEYARDMEVLNLDHNQIKDLTPLAGVTGLRVLILSDNNGIEDLGPLSGLGPQLFHVNLHRSGIQDVGPLSGLTGLRWLSLRVNSIEDVGPLGGLSGLESLILRENQIEDVGPLSGLTGLEELDLRLNPLNRDAYCHGLQEIEDRNPPAFEGHIAYDPSMEPPIGVWASDGLYGDRVRVTWEGLCGGPNYTYRYQVYRSASVSGPKAVISGWQLETSLDDLGAEAGTTYWYWVRADLYGDGTQATDYSLPDEGSR